MDEQVVNIVSQILIARINQLGAEGFDLATELNRLNDPISNRPLSEEEKREIERRALAKVNYIKAHDGALLVPISVVEDPKKHEEWYNEWLGDNNNEVGSYYWKRLEQHIATSLVQKYDPERAGRIVRSIDDATHGILNKLASPTRREFSYKGLVVGYVQSGKTANFTALIAKAADAGYKLILVFGGIHDILRTQTQIRLDRELTGMNDRNLGLVFVDPPSDAKAWNRLTTANNDFSTINLGSFKSYCERSTPTLAVVKKNCRILDRLVEFISQSDEKSRGLMPLLMIDDEADQASIDTHANTPDTEPTRTNERIRTILSLFPRKAYIGYTATPFANVLINMQTDHRTLADDLYPRNFIASLPEPEGYFGTSAIFLGDLAERFVREIPDDRSNLLLHGQMTDGLAKAIDEFLLCCAVRNSRGDQQKPMSMLVHVSHKVGDMSAIRRLVETYLNTMRTKLLDSEGKVALKKEFRELWESFKSDSEQISASLGIVNLIPPFEDIWQRIPSIFGAVRIVELNYASEDILDYTTGEEVKVIAIGGNQLSRGLTLEGLMTSYYLRKSNQYDTLLQMARWFGYRERYEDLTRVHTSSDLWDNFEHLALVEQEMRSEIYRYEEEGKTPAELALAIRAHNSLRVTAPNKMGAGQTRQVSYSESLNQTIWFPLNKPDVLFGNYELGQEFINKVRSKSEFRASGGLHLARAVPGELILREFLNQYRFVGEQETGGPGLDASRLLEYILRRFEDQNSELQSWNVAVIGNENPVRGCSPTNYGGLNINMIQRSRKHTAVGYNIGVLTEPNHLVTDLKPDAQNPYDGRSPQNPLLLLYLVWKESKAKEFRENPTFDERIDLYRFVDCTKVDLLGLAMVLPRSEFEPFNYIGQ